jgi:glycosyltransferase involved in cell wall biosynthesis
MSVSPVVSVVLPVFNCALYVDEAINSVLNQTYRNLDIVIVDDNSDDGTYELCKLYIDNRIRLFRREYRMGISENLNFAFEQTVGDFIVRMDGDDICELTRIEKQVSWMLANPHIMVSGTSVNYFGAINGSWHVPLENDRIKIGLLKTNVLIHPSVILNRNLLIEKFGSLRVYDSREEPCEDYWLWVKISLNNGILGNIDERLINYRYHEKQVSSIQKEAQVRISSKIRLHLLLTGLKVDIDNRERFLYEKIINNEFDFDLSGFLLYLNLRKKLLDANLITRFFSDNTFREYWFVLDISVYNSVFSSKLSARGCKLIDLTRGFVLLDKRLFGKVIIRSVFKN